MVDPNARRAEERGPLGLADTPVSSKKLLLQTYAVHRSAWPGVGLQTRACHRICCFSRRHAMRRRAWPGVGLQTRACRRRSDCSRRSTRRRAWPIAGLQTRTCHRICGFSRRTRCAGEHSPARACRHARVVEEAIALDARRAGERGPAWACRHVRVVEQATAQDARDAPESVARAGLKIRTCGRRFGFSRRTRCAEERGPAWACRHARFVEEATALNARDAPESLARVGLQTRTCHRRCGFSRRTRCAAERVPAWACRYARAVDEAASPDARDAPKSAVSRELAATPKLPVIRGKLADNSAEYRSTRQRRRRPRPQC